MIKYYYLISSRPTFSRAPTDLIKERVNLLGIVHADQDSHYLMDGVLFATHGRYFVWDARWDVLYPFTKQWKYHQFLSKELDKPLLWLISHGIHLGKDEYHQAIKADRLSFTDSQIDDLVPFHFHGGGMAFSKGQPDKEAPHYLTLCRAVHRPMFLQSWDYPEIKGESIPEKIKGIEETRAYEELMGGVEFTKQLALLYKSGVNSNWAGGEDNKLEGLRAQRVDTLIPDGPSLDRSIER